jgi:hypothetical protein
MISVATASKFPLHLLLQPAAISITSIELLGRLAQSSPGLPASRHSRLDQPGRSDGACRLSRDRVRWLERCSPKRSTSCRELAFREEQPACGHVDRHREFRENAVAEQAGFALEDLAGVDTHGDVGESMRAELNVGRNLSGGTG